MATLTNVLSKDELQIELLAKIWAESCEGHRCPRDSWLLGLLRTAGAELAEDAIRRTGRKLYAARKSGDTMDADSARHYCRSVAQRMAGGEFPDRQAR